MLFLHNLVSQHLSLEFVQLALDHLFESEHRPLFALFGSFGIVALSV